MSPVTSGVLMMILLTVDPAYEAAHHWVDAVLWACLAFFVSNGWSGFATPLRRNVEELRGLGPRAGRCLRRHRRTAGHCAGAHPKSAWLLGVFWMFKVVAGIPGLRQLRRVLVLESGPLLSVLVIFLMVLFLASVAVYFLERDAQPVAFGSVPAAFVVGGRNVNHDGIW